MSLVVAFTHAANRGTTTANHHLTLDQLNEIRKDPEAFTKILEEIFIQKINSIPAKVTEAALELFWIIPAFSSRQFTTEQVSRIERLLLNVMNDAFFEQVSPRLLSLLILTTPLGPWIDRLNVQAVNHCFNGCPELTLPQSTEGISFCQKLLDKIEVIKDAPSKYTLQKIVFAALSENDFDSLIKGSANVHVLHEATFLAVVDIYTDSVSNLISPSRLERALIHLLQGFVGLFYSDEPVKFKEEPIPSLVGRMFAHASPDVSVFLYRKLLSPCTALSGCIIFYSNWQPTPQQTKAFVNQLNEDEMLNLFTQSLARYSLLFTHFLPELREQQKLQPIISRLRKSSNPEINELVSKVFGD